MASSTVAVVRCPSRLVAIGIVGFAGALALASQVAVPIPGTPVPITLQPLVVVLAGMWLGPMAGAACDANASAPAKPTIPMATTREGRRATARLELVISSFAPR